MFIICFVKWLVCVWKRRREGKRGRESEREKKKVKKEEKLHRERLWREREKELET